MEKKPETKWKNELTIPKPFHFHSVVKKVNLNNELNTEKSPFIPLAVKVKQFEANLQKIAVSKVHSPFFFFFVRFF